MVTYRETLELWASADVKNRRLRRLINRHLAHLADNVGNGRVRAIAPFPTMTRKRKVAN
jgi:hypothetical protein